MKSFFYLLLAELAIMFIPAQALAQSGYGLESVSPDGPALTGKAGDVTGIPLPTPASKNGLVAIGQNLGAYVASLSGRAVFAHSENNYGLWGQSTTYRGVTGRTDRLDDNFGLYTVDNIYGKSLMTSGALLQVMQNTGNQALSAGDVVSLNGINRNQTLNGGPVVQVSKTQQANNTGVAGVVFGPIDIETLREDYTPPPAVQAPDSGILATGPVASPDSAAPGEYVVVVVLGPALVKTTSLSIQSVQPGDLLSTSSIAGFAQKASQIQTSDGSSFTLPGTVFAKALESTVDSNNMTYVYVSTK